MSASERGTDATPRGVATGRRRRLVVGCGPLGMRVASRWLAAGDIVWGTTRSRQTALTLAGIKPIVTDLILPRLPPLPEVDTIVWAVGFDTRSGRSPRELHVDGLRRVLDAAPGRPRVILSSTTGVWDECDGGIVDEDTPAHPSRPSAAALLEAEEVLRGHRLGPGVALRFAGLYGPERLPRLDQLRAGKPIPVDEGSWLNLIHLDDAANVVVLAADAPSPRSLYVVSDGTPLRRRAWYEALAACTGSPPPNFTSTATVPETHDQPAPPAMGAASGRGGDKRVNPARLFADLAPILTAPNAIDWLTSRASIEG